MKIATKVGKVVQLAPAQARFLAWVKKQFPKAYEHAVREQQQLHQVRLAAVETGAPANLFDSLVSSVSKGMEAYAVYRGQHDLYKLNLQRAKEGKEPIDAAAYAPAVRVQHEVSSGSLPKWVLPTVIGVGALVLLGPALSRALSGRR